jgi:hypothetical protein
VSARGEGATTRNTYELQGAVGAAARASGRPVLDGGRGQPNWTVTTPRAAFFRLGEFAVGATGATSALTTADPYWGTAPAVDGLATRLAAELAVDAAPGARFLGDAVQWAQDELGFEPTPGSPSSCGACSGRDIRHRTGSSGTSSGCWRPTSST